ncbi:MAG: diguanylate cyclase [Cellvibrionaceae bacterium]
MTTELEKQQHKQTLRLRRSMMGLGSYACTLILVLACYLAGLMPGWVVVVYLVVVFVTNAVFLGLILSGLNLRLSRPDMTMEQILCSVLPGLLALYFIDGPQARTAFLLLALVPMIFGILGLNTRRSVTAGLLMYAAYLSVVALLFMFAPQRTNLVGDSIVLLAFFFATLQVSLIGGYISGLHRVLEARNNDLNRALGTIADLVNRDELTGIFNRRYILGILQEECERSVRGQGSFSLAVIDIDHFKRINDSFGHAVGDLVLIRVANAIDTHIRKIDHFARFGGEEFLLIMPYTDLNGAMYKMEQLRELVANLDVEADGCHSPITLSAGVAVHRAGELFSDTIRRADAAMYVAKNSGRNCVRPALPELECPP